jgi:hypothetical protein
LTIEEAESRLTSAFVAPFIFDKSNNRLVASSSPSSEQVFEVSTLTVILRRFSPTTTPEPDDPAVEAHDPRPWSEMPYETVLSSRRSLSVSAGLRDITGCDSIDISCPAGDDSKVDAAGSEDMDSAPDSS